MSLSSKALQSSPWELRLYLLSLHPLVDSDTLVGPLRAASPSLRQPTPFDNTNSSVDKNSRYPRRYIDTVAH
jgi:hypothetical protein